KYDSRHVVHTSRVVASAAPLDFTMAPWAPRRAWGVRVVAARRPAPDRSVANSAEFVRLAEGVAIAASAALPLIEISRMIVAGEPGSVPFALFATVATLALNLHHVIYGLRNQRPPAGGWTLAALATIHALALVFVGRAWALQLPALMVSTLLVTRGPVGFATV